MTYSHTTADCADFHQLVRDFGDDRPTITVLCGSTRFYDEFQQANYDLTMQGHIVLSVGFYPHAKAEHDHGEGVGHDSKEKVALDELHKRKIDLADEVYVLNVGGYIGDSTASEIAYAEKTGRPVRYMEMSVRRQMNHRNAMDLAEWCGGRAYTLPNNDLAYIDLKTADGEVTVHVDDWIERTADGEFRVERPS